MTLHDREWSGAEISHKCLFEHGVRFQNVPFYISDGKEASPIGSVSRLFGSYDQSVSAVRISDDGEYLSATFFSLDNDNPTTDELSGLKKYQSARNKLVINKWSTCKPGEAGVGCVWGQTEISCTEDNDLVVKGVSRGAGLIALVVPLYTSSSFLAVYKRLPER